VSWLPYAAAAFILIGGVVALAWSARMRGRADERNETLRRRLDALKDKREKDDEIDKLAPADIDRRFRRWMRNE